MPETTPGVGLSDPVTGFTYPEDWVTACTNPDLLSLVQQGLAVLTSNGAIRRRGFSTGTTAAAACMAAVLSHTSEVSSVSLLLPSGVSVVVPVTARGGRASAQKYAGDYPGDATADMVICAEAVPCTDGIVVESGPGIGRFSRDTPRFSRGTPAISPSAHSLIVDATTRAARQIGWSGARVLIQVPEGEKRASTTLNPAVGILGGISLLGTTGLVEPWDDHLRESVRERVLGRGSDIVLVTGRTGLRYARLHYPDREAVLVGKQVGEALTEAGPGAILLGLPGLILRFIRPGILDGTGFHTVEELSATPAYSTLLPALLAEFCNRYPGAGIVIIDRQGRITGEAP